MKLKKPIAALVAGLALGTAPANAGGMAEPVMEAEVIAEEATGTGGGWIIPLLLVAVIAAVASSGSSSTPTPPVVE